MVHEPLFELPFRARFGGAEEVEQVRVLERLRGQIGVGWRQRPREVGDGAALALVQPVLDLNREHAPAPTLLSSLGHVPQSGPAIRHLVQDNAVMEPRNLCSSLLHKFALGPRSGEGAHVLEVAGRESPHVQERLAEVVRESVDGPGAPAFTFLAGENRLADVPVEQHHRLVGSQHDTHAFTADAGP